MEKKKLVLKKQTIVDLSDTEALNVKGGATTTLATIVTNLGCAITVGLSLFTVKIAWDATTNISNNCDNGAVNATDVFRHIGADGGAVCVLEEIDVISYHP